MPLKDEHLDECDKAPDSPERQAESEASVAAQSELDVVNSAFKPIQKQSPKKEASEREETQPDLKPNLSIDENIKTLRQ